jgi:hypothetical protein
MRAFLALSLTLALPALAQPAPAKDQPTLAIADVTARGGADPEDASEMNDALTEQLVSDGRLRIVERQQLARVMKEQALSQSGAMSDEAQVKLAQLVGARWIVVGALQKKGRSLLLSLRALDSSSAQVAFAQSLKVGTAEQIEAGSQQLARRLEDKLLGPGAGSGQASTNAVGDFDANEVKDGARQLARSLGARLPKLTGRLVNALPDGTSSCAFDNGQPFAGEMFEVSGKDEVTEQDTKKGYFLLKSFSAKGACSGRVKRERGAMIVDGDTLTAVPLKISVEALEPGAGVQPELAKLLAEELRAALEGMPQFQLSNDPQITATGRVSGSRGSRSVVLQVVDKSGNVLQKLDQPSSF